MRQLSRQAVEIVRYGTGRYQRKVSSYYVVAGRVHFGNFWKVVPSRGMRTVKMDKGRRERAQRGKKSSSKVALSVLLWSTKRILLVAAIQGMYSWVSTGRFTVDKLLQFNMSLEHSKKETNIHSDPLSWSARSRIVHRRYSQDTALDNVNCMSAVL